MLSRVRYDDEEEMVDGNDYVGTTLYSTSLVKREVLCLAIPLEAFSEALY